VIGAIDLPAQEQEKVEKRLRVAFVESDLDGRGGAVVREGPFADDQSHDVAKEEQALLWAG